jgi:hypothetical protein
MAGGKEMPERKSEPSREFTAIDLEMKVRVVHKCEGVQNLSAFAC